MCKLKINRRETTNETEIRQGVTTFCLGLYNNINNIKRDFFKEMLIVQQENTYAPVKLNEMWNTIKSVRATIPGRPKRINILQEQKIGDKNYQNAMTSSLIDYITTQY